ncbi:T9SS type A sorting domain-containing protein [Polaribacter sp. Hel1_85]|uniref:T9SS type A sorting domain-containing protein n=1 Tax=Polaribacter sp. Hel1_85 TaxID=1250005 RepID=UPI00052BF1DC|nr:T9SS type A sorting domain-containing protein [Polaribacter sp. Hel1_85]KGL63874.1 hypothetical protein PHEL85_0916 [Polaribacter sp. Hel1_85]
MKKNYFLAFLSMLFSVTFQAQVTYTGNGNTGFGGTVGASNLNVSDDGTTITFDFSRGSDLLSNAVVIYIDSKSGGFSDTTGFNDSGDGLRTAISTNNNAGNNPSINFPVGFTADFAIAFDANFGAWFTLASGVSHTYGTDGTDGSANLSPTGDNAAATHTLTVDFSELGITANDKFDFVVSYIATSAWLSDEVIGDISSISPGTGAGVNPGPDGSITFSDSKSYPNTWTGTTDNDWATGTNWTEGIPASTHNVYIPVVTNQPTATSAVAINRATLDAGASLIAQSTFTGAITYNVHVGDTDWHLVSSPVVGEGYDDTWVTNNGIASGSVTATNRAIATYQNGTADGTTGQWVYMQGGASGTFGDGVGYSLKRTGAGEYSFTGTFPTTSPVSPAITQDVNNWNLIGNPYPSYIDIAAFITANSSNLSAGFQAIYVWNASTSSYDDLTTGYVHPGQAFFVNSNVASGTASITEAMQSHQSGITFYKSSNPSIDLTISNGTSTKTTQINYLDGKTTSLDAGFDIGIFDGVSSDLRIYSHLIENDEGISFRRQALPDNDYENLVVPVGVKSEAGKEVTFSINANNLPEGINVYLEDRQENTFTRLDEANSNFKVTFENEINGTGRFYLHTNSSALNVNTDVILNSLSIFKSNDTTLRIVGLPQGKTSVSLYNILGKQMMRISFEASGVKDISLSKLATGIYFAKVQTETDKVSKKIILE